MITAEVKVNTRTVGFIRAFQIEEIENGPGDFRPKQVCRYAVRVEGHNVAAPNEIKGFEVTHDRRFGWQGLLHAIMQEILPTIVETAPADRPLM